MESLAKRRMVIVTGRCHPALAADVADKLGVELTEANLREFADGEIHCRIDESIRGAHVFIMQTHGSPVNDAVMEQLIMIDAAKRASAKSITAVIPNYGYARQDRKTAGREPITAKLLADMLQVAGATRVLSVDFHSGQIQGFFDVPVDHLVAAPVLEDYLKANANPHELVVVAPDAGRVKVAERYAQHLGCDLALVHKTRPRGVANVAEARHIVGDVDGRHCVLIDDMIDTAGTIVAGCDLLKEMCIRDRALSAASAYGDVAADFNDDPAARGDVVGDDVGDEGLRRRPEVESAPRAEGRGVFAEVEHDGVDATGRNGCVGRYVAASTELVEVDVVAEGEERREHGGIAQPIGRVTRVERAEQRPFERVTDRDGFARVIVQLGEF